MIETKPNKLACRRCGCLKWNQYTTTAAALNVEDRTYDCLSYIKREFRCNNCDIKSTVGQLPRLEAISTDASLWNPMQLSKVL